MSTDQPISYGRCLISNDTKHRSNCFALYAVSAHVVWDHIRGQAIFISHIRASLNQRTQIIQSLFPHTGIVIQKPFCRKMAHEISHFVGVNRKIRNIIFRPLFALHTDHLSRKGLITCMHMRAKAQIERLCNIYPRLC